MVNNFNMENSIVYNTYDDMRTKWFYDEKKISVLVRILNR